MLNLSKRIDQTEMMDTLALPLSQMRETLGFLSFTNTYFGGSNVVLRFLNRCSQQWKKGEPISILDIGTGGGEIPIAIADWAAKRGHSITVTAIDLVPDVVMIAKEKTAPYSNIKVQQCSFFDLAKEGNTFDYVTASLFLHHIRPHQTTETLMAMDKLSRRGFVMSDLLRSPLSYMAVTLISYLAGNAIVRHDGPLSVRRAFVEDELRELAAAAGLSNYLSVRREPWFRVSLSGEKEL